MFVGDDVTFVHVVHRNGQVIDVSSATELTMTFNRPTSKAGFVKTGALLNDGSDGKVIIGLPGTDLNRHGKWQRQLYIDMPATGGQSGKIFSFSVQARLTPTKDT